LGDFFPWGTLCIRCDKNELGYSRCLARLRIECTSFLPEKRAQGSWIGLGCCLNC
jgi:hypothetical protein